MRWLAGADYLVVGAAASTTRASDQVTGDGGYYNPATRTASPTVGADDLVTGDALMACAGDQVAKDGDSDSWNLISVQCRVLEIQSLESLLQRCQSLEWIIGPLVASFGGL